MLAFQIILVAVILIVIAGAAALYIVNTENERKARTIGLIKGHVSAETKISEKDEQNKRRAEIAKKLKESKQDENKDAKKKKASIALLLGQAGLDISTRQFWIYSAVLMVVMIAVTKIMGQNPIVIIMAGVVGLLGLPRLILKIMAGRRQKKFLMEFADALEAVVRLLKAGMPVSEAISMISREFTGPVGEEMSRVYDKQKIGVPLHEAAMEATKRMPLPEMKMFATGLAIQAQTGSSLSEVLTNLASVIRARFKLKRKIKALSSEAIASACIIGALPNLLALSMYFANHDYIMVLFTDPFGKVLLVGAVIWMSIGIIVMKIMINFKI